jgi:K+-sensing histidine kinase KdpD
VSADQTHQRQKVPESSRLYSPVDESELTYEAMQQQLIESYDFSNRVRALSDIALQIDAAKSRDEILGILKKESVWIVDHEVSFLAVLNSSRTHYSVFPTSEGAEAGGFAQRHFLLSRGSSGWVIDHRMPVRCEVTAAPAFDDEIEGVLHEMGMRHLLIAPLQTSYDTIGAILFCTARSAPFSDTELLLAQFAALHIAAALKNSAMFDEARKRIAQIELVNEIAEKLNSTLDLDELLNSAAKTIRDAFNYFDVTIFQVDKEAEDLVLVAHSGNYGDFLPHGYRQKIADGIIGYVAREGKRVMVNDVSEDPRYITYEYHSTHSELAIPIRIKDEVVGILNVEDTKLDAFDETDAIVLETLCDQLGSAMKNAKLFDQVKRANETLKELDRMKSDFLGIVSHDFRTPLASIILAARSMLKHGSNMDRKRVEEYLTIIVDQANRLSLLAEDTLSITKIESGLSEYHFHLVNVERLIKDAVALVNFSRRHIFKHSVDPNVAFIRGDQSKLRQLVHNLLSNAVKYSPRGGLVQVIAEPYQGDQVLLTVTDEGIGIPCEQVGKLFQKFSRVNTTEAKEIKGSGLGLWICSEIVKAHGGKIWVESEPGKGSTFKVLLKASRQESQGGNEKPSLPMTPTPG